MSVGVDIQGVSKHYGEATVLDGASLHVQEGEFMTLLGPSGSGKTTLLRIIAGFETLDDGKILVRGRDISPLSPADRGIGMVFQQYALFPHMTVADNIAYGLKLRGLSRQARQARVAELLELVGLAAHRNKVPRQLSGGQQQRVALARAIAYEPDLLLMDEPLGALDRALRVGMEEELRRIHRSRGVTVLYVTHDKQEALALSDRIAVIRTGRIEAVGTPEDLYYRPPSSFVASFFSGANLIPVEVVGSAEHGRARVRCFGDEFDVTTAGEPANGAVLVVRPRCLRRTGARAVIAVDGVVQDSLLFGDEREIHIAVEGVGRVDALVDGRDSTDITVGSRLEVFFVPDEALLVPAESGRE